MKQDKRGSRDRPRRPRGFIVYSMEDSALANRLVNELRRSVADDAVLVQKPSEQPKPGESIARGLSRAIDTSDFVILLWTPRAARSQWVNMELGFALARVKPVLVLAKGPEEEMAKLWSSSLMSDLIWRTIDVANIRLAADAVKGALPELMSQRNRMAHGIGLPRPGR